MDGSCLWPGGPGGATVVTTDRTTGDRVQEVWGITETTNNAAELLAVILALESRPCKSRAVIHTDSQYVIDGVRDLATWARDGWCRRGRRGARRLAHPDLWKRLHRLLKRRRVVFRKVEAHSGVPNNEAADSLAFKAALYAKDYVPKTPDAPAEPWHICRFVGDNEPEFLSRLDRCVFAGVDDDLYIDPEYLPKDRRRERRRANSWYGTGRGARKQLARALTPLEVKVEAHVGTHRDLLKRYVRAAQAAAEELDSGTNGLKAGTFLSKLFRYATSYRMLRCGWDLTVLSGSLARGVDGLNIDDYAHWVGMAQSTIKGLKHDLRDGRYRPAALRRVYVEKPGGRGKRPIDIPTVEDRIVDRALVLTLAPLLEPGWHPCSIGFRSGHGPQHGLVIVDQWLRKRSHTVALTVDIRKAFTSIPKDRLVHAVRATLPDGTPEQLVALVNEIILRPLPRGEYIRKSCGIAQGSPLSPLLLNLYLDRHLDSKWDHQRWPIVRYADDALLLADSRSEAELAFTTLRTLLQPNGLNLRDEQPEPVDLRSGGVVEWIGYSLALRQGRLRTGLADAAWDKLADSLHYAARADNTWERRLSQALSGWLEYAAPTYRAGKANADYRADFVDRIAALADAAGMGAQRMPPRVIHHTWRTAHTRWVKRRRRLRARMDKVPREPRWAPPTASKTAAVMG